MFDHILIRSLGVFDLLQFAVIICCCCALLLICFTLKASHQFRRNNPFTSSKGFYCGIFAESVVFTDSGLIQAAK